MAIRCSILGHDFGEAEVEREREEDGNEVVETVREVQTCSRCGKEKLLSENTNVTSLGRPGDDREGDAGDADVAIDASDGTVGVASDDEDGNAAADTVTATDAATEDGEVSSPDDGSSPGSDEVANDAEIIEETADETAAAEEARGDTAADVVAEAESEPAPENDDAVILDEDTEPDRDREPGEWPDADDTGDPVGAESDPSAWPDQEGEDEGYDATLDEGDAEVDFGGGGLTPDVDGVADSGEEVVGSDQPTGETGITSAGAALAPDAPANTDSADTEFACPECGYTVPATRSSLRAGDICPECRHGYIAERER